MKFLDKLGLALFSIVTLVISVVLCLIGFGWMEPAIFSILIDKILMYQTYTYVMIGVCIVLILLAVRCIFFSEVDERKEEDDTGILLQNEDGKLLITVETLKNIVEGVAEEIEEITYSEPNVIVTKDNEIIIDVEINVIHDTIIKNISSQLQMKIKKSVKNATGLEIQSVNVRIKNVENSNENEKIEKVVKNEIKKDVPKQSTKQNEKMKENNTK